MFLTEGKAYDWLTQSSLDATFDQTVDTVDSSSSSLLFTVGKSPSKAKGQQGHSRTAIQKPKTTDIRDGR